MSKIKFLISCLGVVALATMLVAADKKKAAPAMKGPGILQPQMTVEGSTYATPMGKMGEKADQPWSATTVGAAVNGKAQPGNVTNVTGEIVDFSCYLQIGKHGEKHKACGQKCLKAGQPIGLLAADGTLYMLMEEEHDPRRDGQGELRTAATDHLAHIMDVTGTLTEHNGYKAIFVTGYTKK